MRSGPSPGDSQPKLLLRALLTHQILQFIEESLFILKVPVNRRKAHIGDLVQPLQRLHKNFSYICSKSAFTSQALPPATYGIPLLALPGINDLIVQMTAKGAVQSSDSKITTIIVYTHRSMDSIYARLTQKPFK